MLSVKPPQWEDKEKNPKTQASCSEQQLSAIYSYSTGDLSAPPEIDSKISSSSERQDSAPQHRAAPCQAVFKTYVTRSLGREILKPSWQLSNVNCCQVRHTVIEVCNLNSWEGLDWKPMTSKVRQITAGFLISHSLGQALWAFPVKCFRVTVILGEVFIVAINRSTG